MKTPPLDSLLAFAVTLATSVVNGSAAAQGTEPGEGPNLTTTVTQDDIRSGALTLTDIIDQGELVFSTPFNGYDGLGDGPTNPDDTLSPGGRSTLQANPNEGNGFFLRMNGLDSQTCLECHSILSNATIPAEFRVGGVGGVGANAIAATMDVDVADLDGKGYASFDGRFINPPFVFGSGGIELLAKEMTRDLQEQKRRARRKVSVWFDLRTHGVSFGQIRWVDATGLEDEDDAALTTVNNNCSPTGDSGLPIQEEQARRLHRFVAINRPRRERVDANSPDPSLIPLVLDTSRVVGIDGDLVVRPFGRKGNNVTTRDFDCGAMRFHFGMEPSEIVGEGVDGDGDSVADEVTIGEMSALAIFNTHQEPPCELHDNPDAERGRQVFADIGCADCHRPAIATRDRVLPYQYPEGGPRPFDRHTTYFQSDLSQAPASFPTAGRGLMVRAFTDLKRHDMGKDLQETLHAATDEENRSFITARLWGVADTAPYLHDGRAPTLTGAIGWHGGEAAAASAAFFASPDADRIAVLSYLRGLRTPGNCGLAAAQEPTQEPRPR